MAAIINPVVTESGENLISKGEAGKLIKLTDLVIGDGFLPSGQDTYTTTGLVNELFRFSNIAIQLIGNSQVAVSAPFTNEQLQQGFEYREAGVLAEDPDTGVKRLYAYGNAAGNAEYIPPGGGSGVIEKIIKFILEVGRATNIYTTIASGIYVPIDYLPNTYIATVDHNLGMIPVGALYAGDYAFGVGGYGEGPYGGTIQQQTPVRLIAKNRYAVDVYAQHVYNGLSNAVKLDDFSFALTDPTRANTTTSLTLVLR